tara:strand:+ start:642 stop:809 length:168 start_codon:yes stop_codon:yes gene_type:complete
LAHDISTADITSARIPPAGVIALEVHEYPRGKHREASAQEALSVAWRNIRIKEMK